MLGGKFPIVSHWKPEFYCSTCKYYHCSVVNLMWPYNSQCWMGKIPWLEGTNLNAQLTFIWTIQTTGVCRNGSEILWEDHFRSDLWCVIFPVKMGKTHLKVSQNPGWVDLDKPQIMNYVVHGFSFAATTSPMFVFGFTSRRKNILPAK